MWDSILYTLGLVRVSIHEELRQQQLDLYYREIGELRHRILMQESEIAQLTRRPAGRPVLRVLSENRDQK